MVIVLVAVVPSHQIIFRSFLPLPLCTGSRSFDLDSASLMCMSNMYAQEELYERELVLKEQAAHIVAAKAL
eukprot:6484971-Amphidinium_carterae.2